MSSLLHQKQRWNITTLLWSQLLFLLLAKAQKSSLLFPQSLFKPSAISLETLLCYFSGYFNTVHAQLSSSSCQDSVFDTWPVRVSTFLYPVYSSHNQSHHLTYSAPLLVTAPGRSVSAVFPLMYSRNCTDMWDSCITLQPYRALQRTFLFYWGLAWCEGTSP